MIVELFPTSVYVDSFSLTEEEKEYISTIPIFRNIDDEAWVSDNYLHKQPQFETILNKIQQHVECYAYDEMKLSKEYTLHCHGAWLNKNDKGDKTSKHHHSNSFISGVYYLDVNSTEQGGISFYDDNDGPFGRFFTLLRYSEITHRNSHIAKIESITDRILLFPSILKHSVDINRANNSRFSLAFDYMIGGTYNALVNEYEYKH
jgi:uncharacterized protein (TIGR02466 family)